MIDVDDIHEYNRLSLLGSKLYHIVLKDIIEESNKMALECIRAGEQNRAHSLAIMDQEMSKLLTRVKANYKKNNKREMHNV